jgi:tRNA/tmRNA/rRNA uracil-C5-methylase (TrmA/RlmC/RlmD family)
MWMGVVGLISQALAPYCKKIVGVDISPGTVEYYNTRVQNQGISDEEMKAVCVDLKGEEGELEGIKFDIVVVSSFRIVFLCFCSFSHAYN